MKKIQITMGALIILAAGFLAGSYYPIDTNLVELQRTKQGLFIITNGNLYTVSLLVTDDSNVYKMRELK